MTQTPADDRLDWAPEDGHGEEVLYAVDGPLGRVRLNRPRAINALDRASVDSLLSRLTTWATDDAIQAVVIDGAGERGLCAGGDVVALRASALAGRPEEAMDYWRVEYAVDELIAAYPKPYVAWMDGIVMGGGVGVSAHGSVRLATERTRVAMPETIIGFFPDVGGLWFLAHAPGEVGTYAALTGATVSGADAVVLGMADAVVPSASKEAVLEVLRAEPGLPVGELLQRIDVTDAIEESSWLEAQHEWIARCFAGDDAGEILRRLRAEAEAGNEAAAEAESLMAARSPHSVAITLAALRRAESMTVQEVLAQDLLLGRAFAEHPDFAEGVRAQLVDKDRSPHWTQATVDDVDPAVVAAAFTED